MLSTTPIQVIDLFAGPGGLGEGFSACGEHEGRADFRVALSVERDSVARTTLPGAHSPARSTAVASAARK
jgi:site-specific DNA-cytosine methylase